MTSICPTRLPRRRGSLSNRSSPPSAATHVFVRHGAAVRLGRRLAGLATPESRRPRPLFTTFYASPVRAAKAPAVRRHGGVPRVPDCRGRGPRRRRSRSSASSPPSPTHLPSDDVRLVFVAEAGPGGGGGGGGLQAAGHSHQSRDARHDGRSATRLSGACRSLPNRRRRRRRSPRNRSLSSSRRSRPQRRALATGSAWTTSPRRPSEVHGAGSDGGVGTGTGDGIGAGRGSGLGEGSGGGTGGGVFRAGSGVEPPRVIREMKADYPDEARRRGIEGEVVVELVVRRDGSVGDARIVRRLSAALDERALRAVRQWRFEPGKVPRFTRRRGGRSGRRVQVALSAWM